MKVKSTITLVSIVIVAVLAIAMIALGNNRDRIFLRYERSGVSGLLRMAADSIDKQTSRAPVIQEPIAYFQPVDLVLAWLAEQPSMSIVQIGAYIGDTPNDPLFKFLHATLPVRSASDLESTVVLVEPIREYFDQLTENYAGVPDVEFENLAISEIEGVVEMYRLDADPEDYGLPSVLSQLSSLKKERMEGMWDDYEQDKKMQDFYLEHRVKESVKSIPLQALLDRHGLRSLDLLQVDAEGYDFEILKTLDFGKIKPRFINYERVLLGDSEWECREMLSRHGYTLVDWGQETLAILRW